MVLCDSKRRGLSGAFEKGGRRGRGGGGKEDDGGLGITAASGLHFLFEKPDKDGKFRGAFASTDDSPGNGGSGLFPHSAFVPCD